MSIIQNSTLLERTIKELWDDRVGFVKYVIGVTPTNQQGDALVLLDKYQNVTVKSGHGTGKSGVEAWGVLHYMSCRPFPKIPCTAPSKHQLYDVLWAELSKWHRKMNPTFRDLFEWTRERFFHKAHPGEWFAVARTASKDNPDALQGIHADYVFRVIDEASGIADEIFDVQEGAHGRIETRELMCGNPTRLEGNFYRSHTKDRALYKTLTWSCLDSPIVPEGYASRIEKKFGKDSNIYRVRVLGQFPLKDGDSYIPYDLVNDALVRDIPAQAGYKKVFGCDIARFGDDATVIAIRQGDSFKPYHVLRNKSTMEVAGYIIRLARDEKPEAIFIDVIGLGAGVYDRVKEIGLSFCEVIPVNVAEAPAFDSQNYRRLRDELWGNMRTWLEMRRGRLWDNEDGDLLGELTSPRYRISSDGKIIIESKDDMRRRGVSSPNIADAHNMTFAQPIASDFRNNETMEEYELGDEYQPFDPEIGY